MKNRNDLRNITRINKKIKNNKILSGVIAFLLILMTVLSVFPAGNIISAADEETIYVTANGLGPKLDYDFLVPYSDSYFTKPSNVYNHKLAQASVGLAISAFRYTPDVEDEELRKPDKCDHAVNIKRFFEEAGFENAYVDIYKTEPTADSICYAIGSKEIDDFTLIAIPVCGASYGKEWASNLTIGTGELHQGFDESSEKVIAGLEEYIEENNIEGKIKIWAAGYSRAAAVSNVLAAKLTSSGEYEDVYAYTFATPETTKNPGNYDNIFNIVGKADIVPKIPLAEWGFSRYGTTLYTKSIEADSDFMESYERANNYMMEITGKKLPVNSAIDQQILMLIDYLYMLMPTVEDYTEHFQNIITGIIAKDGIDKDNAINELITTLKYYAEENKEIRDKIYLLIDYILDFVDYYFLKGNGAILPEDNWMAGEGIKNLVIEHLPFKYLTWVMSSDNPEEIFTENLNYTILSFYSEADIELLRDGIPVEYVSANGETYNFYPDTSFSSPSVIKAEGYTGEDKNLDIKYVITLPGDADWTVKYSPANSGDVTYTANYYVDGNVSSRVFAYTNPGTISGEKYYINVNCEPKPYVEDSSISFEDVYGDSAPTGHKVVLRMYTESTLLDRDYFYEFFIELLVILICLVILGITALIFTIIRLVRKRQRNFILSMIFHYLAVLLFMSLAFCFWQTIPVATLAKTIPEILAALVVWLFALTGYKRYGVKKRRKWLFLIPLILAVDILIEYFFILQFTGLYFLLPVGCFAASMIIAIMLWKRPKQL